MTTTRRHVLALAAALLRSGRRRRAQAAWPSKPIRIIVPYPPGGSSDIIARAISQPLSEALKQTGHRREQGRRQRQHRHRLRSPSRQPTATRCCCATSARWRSPRRSTTSCRSIRRRTCAASAMLAYSPHLLVVHPSVPANNLKELVALSQKQPSSNFAVTAIGSAPHLAGVAVERATKAQVGVHALQGRRAGDQRHRRRPDPGADERHAGHAAARAVRQAEGAGRVEGHPRAAAGQRADHRRAGRATASSPAPGRACWCRPARRRPSCSGCRRS